MSDKANKLASDFKGKVEERRGHDKGHESVGGVGLGHATLGYEFERLVKERNEKINSEFIVIHPRSQKLIDAALEFATKAHEGQVRKYTGEPYINHPIEVAKIVASVTDDCECICAALLHDVIEDCGVTKKDLIDYGFGFTIAEMVCQLSDVSKPEDGNRAERKRIDREHTANAWDKTKTVKLADLISNTSTICKYDEGFAQVYMLEKELLLEVLCGGNETLFKQCQKILEDWRYGRY